MSTLLRTLKHWFIPHEGNNHQPHLLRTAAVLAVIAVAILAEGALLIRSSNVLPHSNFLAEILNSVLVSQTNDERVAYALETLRTNPVLEAAALAKANDMAAKGYFAHTSPEGVTPWFWLDKVGYEYSYAGENLAVNFTDSRDVTNAWMNSPLHRANILNYRFREIGIASARGFYNGREAIFVVQFFGTPPILAARAATPIASPTSTAPVAKATTSTPIKKQPAATTPTFIAKESPQAATSTPSTPATSTVASASSEGPGTAETAVSSVAAAVATNPGRTVNVFLIFLGALMLLALGLKIFHVGFAYPRLVMNGLSVLILLTGLLAANYYLVLAATEVV